MIPADYSPPTPETPESVVALAEAKRRRGVRGYEPPRPPSEEWLPSPERMSLLRRAGLPPKTWGVSLAEDLRVYADGRKHSECLAEARASGGVCVVEGNAEAIGWVGGDSQWRDEKGRLSPAAPYDPCTGSLWLEGPPGRGKSLLASAAAQRLLTARTGLFRGRGTTVEGNGPCDGVARVGATPVLWMAWHMLSADQDVAKSDLPWGAMTPIKRACTVGLLVIDDFLKEPGAKMSWDAKKTLSRWELVVGERYDAELPVVVTSNQPLDAVRAVSERLWDRLNEMCGGYSLPLGGPSWRSGV